jgi:SAM-dependent methyltransferase
LPVAPLPWRATLELIDGVAVNESELERHEAELASVQAADFRAANLFRLVGAQVPPVGSVLDVGCGAGGMIAFLLERGNDARGIDTSAPSLRAARGFLTSRGLDPDRVRCESVADVRARGGLYDAVISMDCLEHVEDDAALFADLVGLVRPGGRLVVTVPAIQALYGERDRLVGHYRRYDRRRLEALARPHPLRVDQLRYWNLLGVAPTFVSHRVLRRRVDESFRWGPPSLKARAVRATLGAWFRHVENAIRPPLGLTLLLAATRTE